MIEKLHQGPAELEFGLTQRKDETLGPFEYMQNLCTF